MTAVSLERCFHTEQCINLSSVVCDNITQWRIVGQGVWKPFCKRTHEFVYVSANNSMQDVIVGAQGVVIAHPVKFATRDVNF